MFDFINVGLGAVLRFFSNIAGGNFIVGLLVFAVIINIIMLPFGIKQQKTSIRHARLQPREAAIRKKYAGRTDRATQQKMQQEIMEMYQQEGYNQLGGCLPMVLQMVVIIILLQVILKPIQFVIGVDKDAISAAQTYITAKEEDNGLGKEIGRSYTEIAVFREMKEHDKDEFIAGFEAFAANYTNEKGDKVYTAENIEFYKPEIEKIFESKMNFDLFGIKNFLAKSPTVQSLWTFPWTVDVWLVLVPLLNFVGQFFSMKITRKFTFQPMQNNQQQMGCSAKAMDWMMPALTLFIAFSVPAAIGVYWLFNNLLGMGKTVILYKTMPMPQFTEEDYKAAEKALKSSGKSDKAPRIEDGVRSNPNSLHTIDFEEEDYAVLPDYESVYDKSPEEREQAKSDADSKGEPNDKIGSAPLKQTKKDGDKKK